MPEVIRGTETFPTIRKMNGYAIRCRRGPLRRRPRHEARDRRLIDANDPPDLGLRLAGVELLQRVGALVRRQLRLTAKADAVRLRSLAPRRRTRPDHRHRQRPRGTDRRGCGRVRRGCTCPICSGRRTARTKTILIKCNRPRCLRASATRHT